MSVFEYRFPRNTEPMKYFYEKVAKYIDPYFFKRIVGVGIVNVVVARFDAINVACVQFVGVTVYFQITLARNYVFENEIVAVGSPYAIVFIRHRVSHVFDMNGFSVVTVENKKV